MRMRPIYRIVGGLATIALGMGITRPGWALSLPQSPPPAPSLQAWKQALSALPRLKGQEQTVMGQLFTLNGTVLRAQERVSQRLQALQAATATLLGDRKTLANTQRQHRDQIGQAVRLLRFVEFLGPSSELGILLGAQNWSALTQRLGAVSVTLSLLHRTLATLTAQQAEQTRQLRQVMRDQAQLAAAESAAEQGSRMLVAQQQKLNQSLAQLGTQASFYRTELNRFQHDWADVVGPYLQSVEQALAQLPTQNLSLSGMTVSSAGGAMEVTISETGLNQLIASVPALSGLQLQLGTRSERLQDAQKMLSINGQWRASQGTRLRFAVQSVTFDGIAIDAKTVSAVVGTPGLEVNLAPILQSLRIQSVSSGLHQLHLVLAPG